jgi:cell wall-associated NlpC family hydrolase
VDKKLIGVGILALGGLGYMASKSGSGGFSLTGAISRQQFLALARGKLGKPYIWGATGPDEFDCSGLVQWCYGQLGISVPRQVTEQAQGQTGFAPLVKQIDSYDMSKSEAFNLMVPGDCIALDSDELERYEHVGIFTGTSVIHASGGILCPMGTSRCKVVEDSKERFGNTSRHFRTIFSYIA